MKILSSASSHPEMNPKSPSRTEMDALPDRGDSGDGLPQDGNGKHGKPGKHGRLGGFGTCRTWHWSGYRA